MNLNELYEPDGVRLTTKMIGAPGSGKSFFTKNSITAFMNQNDDPMMHVVYVCPKWEMDLGKKTLTTTDKLYKHMKRNRLHVIYPDPETVDSDVDEIIATVFDIRASNPEFKCCLVVDDVQIFLSARRETSPQFRRLALVGRSMNIRFVAISHGFVFSKALEGSTSYIVHFRTLMTPIHIKDAMNRYGYDPQPYVKSLNEVPYSHVMFDVTKGTTRLMRPINVTSPRRQGQFAR
jgi:hypothetical protein